MITCSNCQTINDDSAKFCQNCGHPLIQTCGNCGTKNDASARFCKNCGHPLIQEAQPAPIRAPAPSPVANPAPAGLRSERRIVTILFADVKGSTTLAEKLDPEEWTEIMNGTFDRMIHAVTRYDGTVARLMGDSVLALFGAPHAHEDDPYRAVLAGLDMLEDLHPYQKKIRRQLTEKGFPPDPTDFEVRIGINTGLVVVGRVGPRDMGEYTAMGDAVNLASRLEQTAQPGTVHISQDTYRLVSSLIDVEPLGPIQAKGKSEKVDTYKVIGIKNSKVLRGIPGLSAPLVGRDPELESLKNSVRRLHAGHGQIASLIGEAGLGKSRLVNELKNDPSMQHCRWVEAASLSFESNQPFGLIKRLLQREMELSSEFSQAQILEKVEQRVAALPQTEQQKTLRVLETLFSLHGSDGEQPLEGEDLKRQLLEQLTVFWRTIADSKPLMLVLEDLHWADPASVDLIIHLFQLSDVTPIYFLCVYRPDRDSPAWLVKQEAERKYPHRYQEIALRPLTAQDSSTLINNLLQISDISQNDIQRILDKTEGNPFFVEEIVRELIEKGSLVPREDIAGWRLAGDVERIEIPDSLEALLISRLDRLETETRRTLQLAAVIGRSFYYRVLRMVAEGIDRLDQDLHILQQTGLIREEGRDPELEYMFRHVLTQEAAYNTILLSQRRQFHQQTGEVMERLFTDRLEEHAPLLAHHFLQAGNEQRALVYFSMAADSSARLNANLEAVTHYTAALKITSPETYPEQRIVLLRGRGQVLYTIGEFMRALRDQEEALDLARDTGSLNDEWRSTVDLGHLWASRDYAKAGDYFREALDIARQLNNPAALARSLNRLGNWHTNADNFMEADNLHQEALALFREIGDEGGVAETLDLLGMANLLGANPVEMAPHYNQAIEIFRKNNNRFGLISSLTALKYRSAMYQMQVSYTNFTLENALSDGEEEIELSHEIGWKAGESWARWGTSSIYGPLGKYDMALSLAFRGLELATEIQHRQWMAGANTSIGAIFLDILDHETAIKYLETARNQGHEVGSNNWIGLSSGMLARAYLFAQDPEQAAAVLDAFLTEKTPMGSVGQRHSWWARSELYLAADRFDEALAICDRLIDTALSRPPDGVITAFWELRGRILESMGRQKDAETIYQEGIGYGEKIGEKALLWRLQGDLGRLYTSQGRQGEAWEAFSEAQQIIEALAATIPDETQREPFRKRAREHMVKT